LIEHSAMNGRDGGLSIADWGDERYEQQYKCQADTLHVDWSPDKPITLSRKLEH
jgi:hypothetical protein